MTNTVDWMRDEDDHRRPTMTRVLVTGDRDWGKYDFSQCYRKMHDRLKNLPNGTVLIQGGATGADTMAKGIAQALGFIVITYDANWDHQHRAAGPIRNSAMLSDGKPELVLAFHDDIEGSKGTKDMVTKARKAGVPTEIIKLSGDVAEVGQ